MIAIRWTETAVADLISIKEYIGRDSPLLSHTVVARLYGAVEQIATFPLSGREVPERVDPSLRELVRPPYRIVYEVVENTAHILTIFHSARLFPDVLERAQC